MAVLREIDIIRYYQKIVRKSHLVYRVQLVNKTLLHGRRVGVSLFDSLPCQHLEVFFVALISIRDIERRQVQLAEFQLDVALFRDLERI